MRLIGLAVACAALLARPVACTDGHPVSSSTVTGRLLAVGGPPPGASRPMPGTVRLENVATHVVTTVHVGPDGRYSASVSAGSYKVKGRSPLYGNGGYACTAAKTVTATAKTVAVANVYCQMV